MNSDTNKLIVEFDIEMRATLAQWKKKVWSIGESIKERLQRLIEEDLRKMEARR